MKREDPIGVIMGVAWLMCAALLLASNVMLIVAGLSR